MSGPDPKRPVVSIIIANFNGAVFLADTLASAGAQTLGDIEILVCDDGSTDGSVDLVAHLATRDARIRLLESGGNGGPAKARNVCLDAARGEWIAILDSDDLMHPRRLELMLAMAASDQADIVADNVIAFDNARRTPAVAMLAGSRAAAPFVVSAVDYVKANTLAGNEPPLGYLKPLIRRTLLQTMRYDERLRIAEDYDLILRLLIAGASFVVHPLPLYFYRRHASSISHRLSPAKLKPMLSVHEEMAQRLRADNAMPPDLADAFRRRTESLVESLAFEELIDALRRRDLRAALSLGFVHPRALIELRRPLAGLFHRLGRATIVPEPVQARTVVLARADDDAGAQDSSPGSNRSLARLHPWPLELADEPGKAPRLIAQATTIANLALGPATTVSCDDPDLLDWAAYVIHPGALTGAALRPRA